MQADGRATRILVVAASLVVVVAGLRAAGSVVVPFLLAAFITVVCSPPLFWLQRRRVPTALAVVLVVLGVMAVGLLIGVLVGTSLSDFPAAVPGYQARIQEQTAALHRWLTGIGIALPEQVMSGYLDPGIAMELVSRFLSGLGGVLGNAFLILLTVLFMLFEAAGLPSKLRAALGDPDASLARFSEVLEGIQRYLEIKTMVSLLTGVVIAIWLAVIGIDYPLLWGLMAFLFNFVPNIGSVIAAVPAVILALIQLGMAPALFAVVGYVVVNVVVGNVIEPRFMGRSVGLSTLVVFLSLVFWGWVLGPVGMLLSVPLTMIVKIALEGGDSTRAIAVMLGSEVATATVPPQENPDPPPMAPPA